MAKGRGWRKGLGRRGEELAARYLEGKGYKILGRNYRSSVGEVDIVAEEEGSLVFVEVRTRSSDEYGLPEESITSAKAQRMIEVAESYIQEEGESYLSWRIDVVAVELSPTMELVRLAHIKNAVTG
jgi:putative endonuclease